MLTWQLWLKKMLHSCGSLLTTNINCSDLKMSHMNNTNDWGRVWFGLESCPLLPGRIRSAQDPEWRGSRGGVGWRRRRRGGGLLWQAIDAPAPKPTAATQKPSRERCTEEGRAKNKGGKSAKEKQEERQEEEKRAEREGKIQTPLVLGKVFIRVRTAGWPQLF